MGVEVPLIGILLTICVFQPKCKLNNETIGVTKKD